MFPPVNITDFFLWYKSQMTKRETFAWLFTQIFERMNAKLVRYNASYYGEYYNLIQNFPTSAVADSERLILIRLDELYWQRFQENDYI